MKIGTLVMGGLAGAAIVMMIQRNQMMSAVAAGVGQGMKRRMSNMKEDAIEKALNMKFASSFKRTLDNKPTEQKSTQGHSGGLDEVEKLAYQDPQVTKDVNEILEQNGQNQI